MGEFHLPADVSMVFLRGQGSKLYDADGREYVDFLNGSGPMILGHCHPAVVEAVTTGTPVGGKPYEAHLVDVLTLRDGKIAAKRSYRKGNV